MHRHCSPGARRFLPESWLVWRKNHRQSIPRAFDIWRSPIKDEPISRPKDHAVLNDDTISPLRAGAARLRRGLLWGIFALVLMIPKVNRLRRRRLTWNLLRVVMAATGAGL